MIILALSLLFTGRSFAGMHEQSLLKSLAAFTLPSADGKVDSLSTVAVHRATVFVFFSSECPISNNYMPVISKLATEFAASDIAFYGVISDPGVTSDQAKKFSSDYQFPRDILMDSKQELATLLKAHITPEVVIISQKGKIEYDGRVDDRYVALGKGRMKPLHNDLHDALASIAAGKKVANPKTKVIGCWIPKIDK